MITITPIQTTTLFTATPTATPVAETPAVSTGRRGAATMLRRLGDALRQGPTPSEQVLENLQDVDTLRRW